MFSQIYALLCTFDANWKAESLLECMVVVVLIHPRILNQRGRGACMHVDWATLSYIQLRRKMQLSEKVQAKLPLHLRRSTWAEKSKEANRNRCRRKETQIGEGHSTLSNMQFRRKNATEWEGNFVQARLPETKETNRNYNRCLRKETQIGEEPNTLSYIQFRRKEKEYFLRWTWAEKFKEAKRNKCRSKEIWIGEGARDETLVPI